MWPFCVLEHIVHGNLSSEEREEEAKISSSKTQWVDFARQLFVVQVQLGM